MENTFLKINKEYFGTGLKSIDLLIIAHIEEFTRNNCECYLTNEQFSNLFGESVSTIKRSLDKLEEQDIVKRSTSFIEGYGRANKQRVLSLNNRIKWKVHNEPTIDNGRFKMNLPLEKNTMEGSNCDNGRFKSEEWKVHNEPIKDKEKDKEKDKSTQSNDCCAADALPLDFINKYSNWNVTKDDLMKAYETIKEQTNTTFDEYTQALILRCSKEKTLDSFIEYFVERNEYGLR